MIQITDNNYIQKLTNALQQYTGHNMFIKINKVYAISEFDYKTFYKDKFDPEINGNRFYKIIIEYGIDKKITTIAVEAYYYDNGYIEILNVNKNFRNKIIPYQYRRRYMR